ncbi:MAG: DNA polymerase I [Gammaproteobacteria bacterium]
MRLLLADVAGYLFRAFHAVGDLRTSGGAPTGAVFGVVSMLDKLRRQYPPDLVACVMDAPGKNFRHDICPQYKANRPPIHPDLAAQIPAAKAFIEASGWNLICQSGVEADDVIATLARRGKKADMEVVIASSDKDLMQLVGGGVFLYDSMRGKRYDEKAVCDKFGVPPSAIADYLALVGDSSDNIRGVPKVGAITAAKWLGAFGSLDGIIKNAHNIGGKVGESLRAAIQNGDVALARKLVALRDDVPVDAPEKMQPRPPDVGKWKQLCEAHEFRQYVGMMALAQKKPQRMPALAVIDEKTLADELAKARKSKMLAIDTETIGKPAMQAQMVGFSFCADGTTSFYVPLAHSINAAGDTKQMPMKKALAIVAPFLADESINKIAHNGKYDMHIFANYGISCGGVWDDTKIASYVMEAGMPNSMPALAKRHLQMEKIVYGDMVGKKKEKAADFSQVPITAATTYAAEDAEAAWKLGAYYAAKKDTAGQMIYQTMDRPLMPVLAKMERAGMRIDTAELGAFAADLRAQMTTLENKAAQLAGGAFNLNAPRKLEEVLFDKMGAPSGKRTAMTKARSTGEEVLESLAADYPLAQVALEHRAAAKLLGTYAEALPRAVNPQTGRIHCDFNQTMAATGRLAANSPNLQNIPVRTAEGRRIRRAFIAADGMQLASADYSQIELRLMAHFSGDDNLRAAFARGDDIHRQTAAEVFHIPPQQVDNNQRRAAKAINFGLIYGMSAFGLSRAIGVSRTQAQSYIDRYFSRYPGVAMYMERTRQAARIKGYVETAFGRRLPTMAGEGHRAAAAARAAINAPMQGSAADLIKIAMLAADKWLVENKMQTRMVSQVHDELLLEVAKGEEDAVRENLPSIMCAAQSRLSVSLAVDVRMGDNWDAAK